MSGNARTISGDDVAGPHGYHQGAPDDGDDPSSSSRSKEVFATQQQKCVRKATSSPTVSSIVPLDRSSTSSHSLLLDMLPTSPDNGVFNVVLSFLSKSDHLALAETCKIWTKQVESYYSRLLAKLLKDHEYNDTFEERIRDTEHLETGRHDHQTTAPTDLPKRYLVMAAIRTPLYEIDAAEVLNIEQWGPDGQIRNMLLLPPSRFSSSSTTGTCALVEIEIYYHDCSYLQIWNLSTKQLVCELPDGVNVWGLGRLVLVGGHIVLVHMVGQDDGDERGYFSVWTETAPNQWTKHDITIPKRTYFTLTLNNSNQPELLLLYSQGSNYEFKVVNIIDGAVRNIEHQVPKLTSVDDSVQQAFECDGGWILSVNFKEREDDLEYDDSPYEPDSDSEEDDEYLISSVQVMNIEAARTHMSGLSLFQISQLYRAKGYPGTFYAFEEEGAEYRPGDSHGKGRGDGGIGHGNGRGRGRGRGGDRFHGGRHLRVHVFDLDREGKFSERRSFTTSAVEAGRYGLEFAAINSETIIVLSKKGREDENAKWCIYNSNTGDRERTLSLAIADRLHVVECKRQDEILLWDPDAHIPKIRVFCRSLPCL